MTPRTAFTYAARKAIPQECPKGKEGGKSKSKGDGYKAKGKESWTWGKGIRQVDGEEPRGEWKWEQPEE